MIVPPQGQAKALEMVHEGHPRASCMKSLAQSFMWWPGMDGDVEDKVRACTRCQAQRKSPAPALLHPWKWPQRPYIVTVACAGPFLGKMFLVVVDARSKWLEVKVTSTATSATTIEMIRKMFATHGLPDTLVTDNGSVFTSAEFDEFTRRNGQTHHNRTLPPSIQWPRRACCADTQIRGFEETSVGVNSSTRRSFPLPIPDYSSFYHRVASCRFIDGTPAPITPGPPTPHVRWRNG